MKKCDLVFFFLLTTAAAFAQKDSLKSVLRTDLNKNRRIETLAALCKFFTQNSQRDSLAPYASELAAIADSDSRYGALGLYYQAHSFYRSDTAKFFQYTEESIRICRENNYREILALNYLGLGVKLRTLNRYNRAAAPLREGLESIKEVNSREADEIRADIFSLLSAICHNQGNYTRALEYGLEGLRFAESLDDKNRKVKSYNNLSGVYGELSEPDAKLGTADDRQRYKGLALNFMKKSYMASLDFANQRFPGVAAYNLALFYSEEGQRDSSKYYLVQAIAIGKAIQYGELLSNAYHLMGSNFVPSDVDSAQYYLDEAIRQAEKVGFISLKMQALVQKAGVYRLRKSLRQAEALANEALALSQRTDDLDGLKDVYELLYDIAADRNESAKALAYYKKYVALRDSIVNRENYATIEELKTRYETELKDNEIKTLEQTTVVQALELRQKNFFMVGLIAIILLGGAFIYLFMRQRSLIQQQKMLEVENKFIRFQLNPHFLFNALVSIQRFIMENNISQASSYLEKFAKLMRQFLEYSRQDLITIEQEIDVLRNYLNLQQLRFKNKFDFEIRVDETLDLEGSKIPPMFAQPFVENALEHGIAAMDKQGRIIISLLKKDGFLHLEIQDNGPGIRAEGHTTATGHRSLATKIIRERMELINRSSREKIQLQIGAATQGTTGTMVQLSLPIYS